MGLGLVAGLWPLIALAFSKLRPSPQPA